MASYKTEATCRIANRAAEDAKLLQGNKGPVIDPVIWKSMYRVKQGYKGQPLPTRLQYDQRMGEEDQIHDGDGKAFDYRWSVHHFARALRCVTWTEAFGAVRVGRAKTQFEEFTLQMNFRYSCLTCPNSH